MTSVTHRLNQTLNTISSSLDKTQNFLKSTFHKIDHNLLKSSKSDPNLITNEKQSSHSDLVKPGYEKSVGYWLLGIAFLVYAMICLGAYTRLIKHGHSVGHLHPLGWKGEFDSLQKYIEHYLWRKPAEGVQLTFLGEYLSTIFERVIGFSFLAPFSYFLLRGKLGSKLRNRCLALIAMQFLQGYIGAWMAVQEIRHKQAFHERTIVSPYRLLFHWNTTMIMFGVLIWNGLTLLRANKAQSNSSDIASMRKTMLLASIIHALNFAAGVMVAGVDGSREFNTFPTMDGKIVPKGYLHFGNIFRDFFENTATVQFNHRIVAYAAYAISTYLLVKSRKANLPTYLRRGIMAMFLIVNFEALDGIIVLFTKGHWIMGLLHQSNSVLLIVASLYTLHGFYKTKVGSEQQITEQSAPPKASQEEKRPKKE